MDVDLRGKVAVVIGGSGVLCGTLARALGARGASVVVVGYSRLERAQTVADEIVARGGQAIAARADVLDRGSLQASEQLTATFVTAAPAMLPPPLVTVQVCPSGWVSTVTR